MPRATIGIVMHDFALGGTERIALRLAARWSALGAGVTIFCGSEAGPLRSMVDPRIKLVAANPLIARGMGSRTRLARAAARHFRRVPADVCFVPGNYHWPVAAAVARLPADVRPIVAVQVSAALRKPQRAGVRQRLFESRMRRLLKGADLVFVMSDSARLATDTILRRSIAQIMNLPALDDDPPPPAPAPRGGRTILAAGRLVPEKGFDTLIEAFARLQDAGLRLVIAGEGPERARLGRQAARLGVSHRVVFPGYVEDLRPWLLQARLFVLSSHHEGYGAVVVEALAAGRPVVSTDCTPAVADLGLSGVAGRLTPLADVAAMTRAIADLLAAPPPRPDLLAMRVDGYRIGPIAQRYLDMFVTRRG